MHPIFHAPMKNPAGQIFQHRPVLVLGNREKRDNILFVTVLEVCPWPEAQPPLPELLADDSDKLRLTV
ncbi:MAG TPA: hypothetical protein VNA16_06475 [Abditibacteriaceae bacterium]|nr:hypothetical protein [Abditibacteriaceae bacterium]